MMKTIKMTEILAYYDGIQIFTAQDPIGGQYVGELVDTIGTCDRYVVVGVKPERLDDFRTGRVDLRTLMLEMPTGEWYITMPQGDIDEPQQLLPQYAPITDFDYLPQKGFFLGSEPPDVDAAVRHALEHGKVVTVDGQFHQANLAFGDWRLHSKHGVKTGLTYPGGPTLHGLQLGKHYRFTCAAVIERDPLWRDRQILYLQSVEPVADDPAE